MVGSDQKGEVFYRYIGEFYEMLKTQYYKKRNKKSGERRVKNILTHCLSLAGCVAKIHNVRLSAAIDEDVIHLATEINKKMVITSVKDDRSPPCKFKGCWEIVKDHQKFDILLNTPLATQSPSTE